MCLPHLFVSNGLWFNSLQLSVFLFVRVASAVYLLFCILIDQFPLLVKWGSNGQRVREERWHSLFKNLAREREFEWGKLFCRDFTVKDMNLTYFKMSKVAHLCQLLKHMKLYLFKLVFWLLIGACSTTAGRRCFIVRNLIYLGVLLHQTSKTFTFPAFGKQRKLLVLEQKIQDDIVNKFL